MALIKVKPIETDKDGSITLLNFNSDQANSDPIRAARLMKGVKAGDKEAIARFEYLQDRKMYVEGD